MRFFYFFLLSNVNNFRSLHIKLCVIIIIFSTISLKSFSGTAENKEDSCQLLLLRETQKPLILRKATIYVSISRFMERKDSICIDFSSQNAMHDTIFFNGHWKYPVYLKLDLSFSDMKRTSNTFHYDSQIRKWEVSVMDSSMVVKHKPVGDDFKRRNSLLGLVLIINTAIEMFLALIISRLFGWSHLLVLMVLAANIAAFPVYLISIPNLFLRESIVAIIKILVMLTIGYRKIKHYKIILFACVLLMVGLGIKELLLFLSYII